MNWKDDIRQLLYDVHIKFAFQKDASVQGMIEEKVDWISDVYGVDEKEIQCEIDSQMDYYGAVLGEQIMLVKEAKKIIRHGRV